MPLPSNVHVDRVLSQVANRYANRAFLAPDLFPVVDVVEDSGIYWIYGKERFEAIDTVRAPKTAAKLVDFAMTSSTYQTRGYALADLLSDEELRNARGGGLDLETSATELLADLLLVGWERRVAALLFTTATWANSSPSTKWDQANSDPLGDIDTAVEALPYVDVNTIVMGRATWNAFKRNAAVLAKLGANERGIVNVQTAAELTGIPNWKIGASYYNTAKRGKTETLARIWGDGVWLGFIAGTANPRQLSAGYTFRDSAMQTQREYRRAEHATWIETAYSQDERVTCADAGYYLENVLNAS